MDSTTIDLASFADASCRAMFCDADRVEQIHARLTSMETKIDVARSVLATARETFAIDDAAFDELVRRFADPVARPSAEAALHAFPFADQDITWVATGYSLVLDAIFADEPARPGTTHVVALPAQCPRALWHVERDYTDTGLHYHHWVYAELPAIVEWDASSPTAFALISDRISGTCYWGDRKVRLYRGEMTVEPFRHAARVAELLDRCALRPVDA